MASNERPEQISALTLKSNLGNIIIVRFMLSLICLTLVVGWSASKQVTRLGFVIVGLTALAAIFCMSLAALQVREGRIRYRRGVSWREIAPSEIAGAGAFWPPFIGFVRLNHFVFPWGRIYFALDSNEKRNPLAKGEYPLLRYLRGETEPSKPQN